MTGWPFWWSLWANAITDVVFPIPLSPTTAARINPFSLIFVWLRKNASASGGTWKICCLNFCAILCSIFFSLTWIFLFSWDRTKCHARPYSPIINVLNFLFFSTGSNQAANYKRNFLQIVRLFLEIVLFSLYYSIRIFNKFFPFGLGDFVPSWKATKKLKVLGLKKALPLIYFFE